MDSLYTNDQVQIDCGADRLWEVLTKSEYTAQYMYGCKVQTDWQPGSEILWIGAEDGITYVKGQIVSIDPRRSLAYTVIDPNGKYPDVPENYLHVTYELFELYDGITRLTVKQGDYSKVADGDSRYKDTMAQGGWSSVLSDIKKVAEQQS